MLLTTLVFYVETNNPSGRRTLSSSSYKMSVPKQHKKKKNNQGKKDRKACQADKWRTKMMMVVTISIRYIALLSLQVWPLYLL